VFSRQRYWGEPIPIIHCEACGPVVVPDKDLPVLLPRVESYQPTDTGESPLSALTDWVNTVCPYCGAPGKRETNTMPQWAGSSWYFLRYADPKNNDALASKEALERWLPVDYYVGGVEHAVLHLLYARFYTKFLYDIGVVGFTEPFKKLFNQGMINRDGKKMAKSHPKGCVSPDDMLSRYGCDSLRMYELFIGPPEQDSEWDDSGIEGVYRYLNKLFKLAVESLASPVKPTPRHNRLRHQLIYDITSRLENLSLNTVISGFMEHTNTLSKIGMDKETLQTMAVLLAPFAPHMAEELWERLGNKKSVFTQSWPVYDPQQMKADTIEIALQVNGKLRDSMTVAADAAKDDVLAQAQQVLAERLAGMEIIKSIYVPGRIVNLVAKSE
jgi:leucyl-tRNA synthetase